MTTETKTTVLYLVRHGATDANLARPYVLQGRGINLPLNSVGQRQAARVGKLFEQMPIAAVYSSPMRRAMETATLIARPHNLQIATLEILTECDVGRWEGMSWEGIRREFPQEYAEFQRDPGRTPYLAGESYRDVSIRALPAIERLLEQYAGQTVAVVAHNIINRVCVAAFLGLDLARARDVLQGNGGVNVIRRVNGKTELLTVNSVFHLEEDLST